MAWIYLAESVESHLPYKNGSIPLPTVKSTNTARQFFCQKCIQENCKEHLSGMTLCHLMDTNSSDILTSYMVAFPAKTSLAQDLEKVWKESEADYFSRSCAWPKKSGHRTYSLKMSQLSQAEADFELLKKLPRWGMIVDGVLYPLQALEHYTVGNDGLCYATPTASQANKPIRAPSPTRQNGTHGEDLQDSIGRLHPSSIGNKLCPRWVSILMGYHITWTDLELWAIRWFQNK